MGQSRFCHGYIWKTNSIQRNLKLFITQKRIGINLYFFNWLKHTSAVCCLVLYFIQFGPLTNHYLVCVFYPLSWMAGMYVDACNSLFWNPVLIITGDNDRLVPSWNAERLSSAIPGSCLEVIKHCGHLPHEEKMDEFVSIVQKFLQKVLGDSEERRLQVVVWNLYVYYPHTSILLCSIAVLQPR